MDYPDRMIEGVNKLRAVISPYKIFVPTLDPNPSGRIQNHNK